MLELDQMLSGTSDDIARIAFTVSNAKWMAVTVGLILLAGAVMARLAERRRKAAKKSV
jgi:hypothetical protein